MAVCVSVYPSNKTLREIDVPVDSCVDFLVLNPVEYADFQQTLLGLDVAAFFGGNFDGQVAGLGFLGVISLFVTGLGVGLIINMLRKLR